jgi:hypothetical protein
MTSRHDLCQNRTYRSQIGAVALLLQSGAYLHSEVQDAILVGGSNEQGRNSRCYVLVIFFASSVFSLELCSQ